jgi:hypothetical protein
MPANNVKHGMHKSSEYRAWQNMLQRCLNRAHPRFHQYGARGVTVCEQWIESFEGFFADMGRKPSADMSLDRIDPAGNYEPGNCRWISFDANRRNRRGEYRITEAERTRRSIQNPHFWCTRKNSAA